MRAQASSPAPLAENEVAGWFAGRLPDKLFTGPPAITADRDEILVVGDIDEPEVPADAAEGVRAGHADLAPRQLRVHAGRIAVHGEGRGFRPDEPGRPGNIHFEKYW